MEVFQHLNYSKIHLKILYLHVCMIWIFIKFDDQKVIKLEYVCILILLEIQLKMVDCQIMEIQR